MNNTEQIKELYKIRMSHVERMERIESCPYLHNESRYSCKEFRYYNKVYTKNDCNNNHNFNSNNNHYFNLHSNNAKYVTLIEINVTYLDSDSTKAQAILSSVAFVTPINCISFFSTLILKYKTITETKSNRYICDMDLQV